MGIDDMMYPGRPIPAELIEQYGAEFDALAARRCGGGGVISQMDTHLARDQVRYRPQIMEDGSVQMMLIGFKMQSDIHRYYAMPGARRYAHDLPRSPYYRSSI